VCERWVYDPYFQHFTGEEFFRHQFPHERSDLSHWRKRLGSKLELLLAESLQVAHAAGALRTRDIKRVTVDTTVQPKAITFPTDAKLLHAAIKGLNRLADKCGLQLRQSYLRIAKRAAMMAGRYAHAKQFQCHHRQVAPAAYAARPPHPRYPPQDRRASRSRDRTGTALARAEQSVPSSSASAGGSSIPSTRPRSNASARAKPARPTS
jgi:transposase, IS5 family